MIGFFNNKGDEYTIKEYKLKRKMFNYMWNNKLMCAVSHFGGGDDIYKNTTEYVGEYGKERAHIIADGNRYFYIKDETTGEIWNPGWYPRNVELDSYSCLVGLGYTHITGRKDGLEVTLSCCVSEDEPCELWRVKLKNLSDKSKDISVYPFAEFSLEGFAANSDYVCWVDAEYIDENKMIYAENRNYQKPHNCFNAFIATDYKVSAFDTSKNEFIGAYGDIKMPDALADGQLKNSVASCERMVGVFENKFHLDANENTEYFVVLGAASSKDEAIRIKNKELIPDKINYRFEKLKEHDYILDTTLITAPDFQINSFANYWLKQQMQLCSEVGRGGGKGFRDQLQDSWALAAFNPELSRSKIYETLEQIHTNGICLRGWLPRKDRNMSDSTTWIAPAINAYLKETADFSFLDEKVKYLEGDVDTVWDHILTATRYSINDLGSHGLVRAHDGDWNDSLDGIGKGGVGESVWSTIALYNAVLNIAEMAESIKNDTSISIEMRSVAEKLNSAVNSTGWDGEWYLAGYTDKGEKVGSSENTEGIIYLNPQTWAVITGIADEDRAEKCMSAVEKYLETEYSALTLYPPYTSYNPEIGRLTGFAPGIWENGAPYCHGSAFKLMADWAIGDGDDMYNTIKKILPDNAANPSAYSGAEPYTLTNMYYGPAHARPGETRFSWITGTASWVYRAITQYMLGFHPEYNTITMNPCIPKFWKKLSGRRFFRGDIYNIDIINENNNSKGVKELYVDNELVAGNQINIFGDGKEHFIIVIL